MELPDVRRRLHGEHPGLTGTARIRTAARTFEAFRTADEAALSTTIVIVTHDRAAAIRDGHGETARRRDGRR
ncbi:hypothetical protein ACFY8B_25980 [Streptomyces sp. NPDC012751]|uniref:hypothetical protein n=1 Tax=Streptomyces sp. NPDC012751 TaxID=3364846 RepID=UPI0036902451